MSGTSRTAGRHSAGRSQEPAPDEVRAQVERIVESSMLSGSSRRRTLLRYLVDETLAGRADRLKGYTIALAVFDRDESFDPGTDPVVRLEAGRLRRSLDSYYVDAGKDDPIRITIPTGAYVPHFAQREPTAASEAPPPDGAKPPVVRSSEKVAVGRPSHGRWIAAVGFSVIAMLIAGTWFWRASESAPGDHAALGPAVIVLPFEALDEDDRFLASGLTHELITDLMRFSAFRLYSAPASFRQSPDASPQDLGRDLGVSYVVMGNVRSDPTAVKVGARVVDTGSGEVIWSETYDRDLAPDALLEVQGEIAAGIATTLGQPYGIVQGDVAERLRKGTAPSMTSYECVLQAYAYRRSFDSELHAPTLACLEQAVRRDPTYATAWALIGWLRLDAARFGTQPGEDMRVALAPALEAAQRGVAVDPKSVVSLQALAAINHYLGRYEESERIQRQALALNPNDPDTLAQLGWRLVARGRYDEGVAHVQRAIDRTVSPPGWYFHYIAIVCFMHGDYEGMLAAAERSGIDGSGMSQSFIAIAQGALGNRAAAGDALAKMAEISPELAQDPAAAYRVHHPVDSLVTALVEGLRRAGWIDPMAAR